MRYGYSDEEDLNEYELKREIKDPKQRWIVRIVRSMKDYYKKCPYYDTKSGDCFILFNTEDHKCRERVSTRDAQYLRRFWRVGMMSLRGEVSRYRMTSETWHCTKGLIE